MATLSDRPNTALLVIDVQNGPVTGVVRRDEVVANINTLVEKARAQNVPVIWVQHSDEDLPRESERWRFAPDLARRDEAEPLVHKSFGDAFEGTSLESVLAERAVGRLVVSGVQTDECIRSTIHGAFTRGYDVTLVGDAHTTVDHTEYGAPSPELVIAHTNLYWNYHTGPGRRAGTVDMADVSFDPVDDAG